MIGSLLVCKSCGEPWDFTEIEVDEFLDYFSAEDRIQMRISDEEWGNMASARSPIDTLLQSIHDMIILGQGCFSCGFDPLYKKSYGGALVVGDEVINHGKVHSISGDPPDPSVGIFDGCVEVTFLPESWADLIIGQTVEFNWNEEILVRRNHVV